MMDDTNEIESMLGRYRPAGPAKALRERVTERGRRRSVWPFLEGLAAMLLIGMNLAQIGGSVTQIIMRPRADEGRAQEIAAEIRRLDLPVSDEEARAMARELVAGDGLVLLPVIHGTAKIGVNYGAIP